MFPYRVSHPQSPLPDPAWVHREKNLLIPAARGHQQEKQTLVIHGVRHIASPDQMQLYEQLFGPVLLLYSKQHHPCDLALEVNLYLL